MSKGARVGAAALCCSCDAALTYFRQCMVCFEHAHLMRLNESLVEFPLEVRETGIDKSSCC